MEKSATNCQSPNKHFGTKKWETKDEVNHKDEDDDPKQRNIILWLTMKRGVCLHMIFMNIWWEIRITRKIKRHAHPKKTMHWFRMWIRLKVKDEICFCKYL